MGLLCLGLFNVVFCLKASIEEAEIKLEDLKKSLYEFERDICRGAIHFKTKTIMAEKVERFFEDKYKSMVC